MGFLWFLAAALMLWLAYWAIPRIILAVLTQGRVKTHGLMWFEIYEEIGAELKARRLIAEVRREAAARADREDSKGR